jgi:antirestriction protein
MSTASATTRSATRQRPPGPKAKRTIPTASATARAAARRNRRRPTSHRRPVERNGLGSTGPRIYVADLASYNAGRLHGVWIDAAQDLDDVWAEINAMLRASPYPNVEVTCPDCEGKSASGSPDSHCDTCKGRGKVPSAEEWAIHDHEGFEGIEIGEYEAMDRVVQLANVIDSLGTDAEAFAAWWGNGTAGTDPDAWEDEFREAYRGTYRTLADYAEEVISEIYDLDKILPPIISGHIDWERVARDMELGGDIWTAQGGDGVLVFDNTV